MKAEAADSEAETTLVHVKCTKRLVLNVAMNVKYHSNLLKESQYSVKTATLKENHDIN